jgi:hypothetical protein
MTLAANILNDLDAIISPWGDSAVVTHDGTPATVAGVYESEYFEMDLLSGSVQNAKPAFWCKTSNVPSAAQADTLVVTSELYNIDAVSYNVLKVQVNPPDLGPGLTRYVLTKT